MPYVLRRSGPDYIPDGQLVTPRAMVGFCERCGYEGAPFGITRGGKTMAWRGWRNGEAVCVNRARKAAE